MANYIQHPVSVITTTRVELMYLTSAVLTAVFVVMQSGCSILASTVTTAMSSTKASLWCGECEG